MIIDLRIEVEVTSPPLLLSTIKDLHARGKAGSADIRDFADAVGDVLSADVPLRNAGVRLVHWEETSSSDSTEGA